MKITIDSRIRGVRNRAKHSAKKLTWFAQRNAIMANMADHKPDNTLVSTRLINLLQHSNFIFRRYAAEEINRRGQADANVLIELESKLRSDSLAATSSLELDTLSWFCRVLGVQGNARQKSLVRDIAGDKKMHKKLRRYCKKSLH